MNKIRLIFISILLFTCLFLIPLSFAQDGSSVVDANNQFACELYSKYKSEDGNIFFSPYSISSAIAMTYEGAKGKTADEIQLVFRFPKDDALRRESFLKIDNLINKKDKKYTLQIANALWAQKDYPFLEGYFNLIKNCYSGEATNLDFAKEAEKSRLTINSWVEEQTNSKIKDLIPPGYLGKLTRLVLTNAVYFKASWLKQFSRRNTKEEEFIVSPGNKVKTPMMHFSGSEAKFFNYAETEKLQILELPYEGNDLSMLILLPKNNSLKAVEELLSFQNLSLWQRQLSMTQVDLILPKFKFENKYFMKNTLVEMGMPTAFTLGIDLGGKADFSGMTGNKDLNIDEVIHQAFIAVDEEGTEAAAATAVVACGAALHEDMPVIFHADHPFIFIIQEKESGNILFLGRLTNPIQS